ncbi:MAG: hypothetical protein CVT88_06845 [Candidatus Altiarchaeales archaeon HGW-Altiarchaeales-1]|nr:MAG: hypothetical protein CVT89_04000 [Candidatus Altiarchaeales archaeon HGW-Altiarchaeales-2]PKP58707.1 MAG: hypothetical protein CVT88_06845 [Candidatus Altiarchaeales archaeon HGW-Altiarchaeales-1]
MLTEEELKRIAEFKHLSVRNAEKDYLLEVVLYSMSDFKRILAFKGGTALYKFYNLNRFSEDLDFDITGKNISISSVIENVIRTTKLLGMSGTLYEKEEYTNEINVRFGIKGPLYDGGKKSMSRIVLNLSKRERPVFVERKLLISSYQEIPSFEINVISQEEISAEKIRCIMTRDKPRDIYDLYFLLKKGIIIDESLVNRKCKIYGQKFNKVSFFSKLYQKQKMWSIDLKGLIIGTLPGFEDVVNELKKMLANQHL